MSSEISVVSFPPVTADKRRRRSPDEILDMLCSTRLTPKERRSRLQEECHDNSSLAHGVLKMLEQWERDNPEARLDENSTIADRYHLQRRLGFGTTAIVWQAYDNDLQREVALKVFNSESIGQHWKEVKREACALAAVDSDFIVRVHTVSEEKEHIRYIDLQLCRSAGESGLPVRSLREVEPSSLEEAVSWIAQAARGLHAAHRRDVFHRDVKPANLLVEPDRNGLRPTEFRRVHVTDFGLAVQRLSAASSSTMKARQTITVDMPGDKQLAGTPSYMAPEQARGLPRDMSPQHPGARDLLTRIDVYGLGASLYELLAGRPPYESSQDGDEGAREVMEKVKRGPPVSLRERSTRFRVPAALERIVTRAMATNPAHRHFSALALAKDLEHWLKDEPTLDDERRHLRRVWLWSRRNPAKIGYYASLALLLCLGVAIRYFTDIALQAMNAADQEEREAGAQIARSRKEAEAEVASVEAKARRRIEQLQKELEETLDHDRGVATQEKKKALASMKQRHETALADQRIQHETVLASMKQRQETALATLNSELEERMNEARTTHEAKVDELNNEWELRVAAATREQGEELRRQKQSEMAELNAQWEQKVAELTSSHDVAVNELKSQWEQKTAESNQSRNATPKELETPVPAHDATAGASTSAL